MEATREFSLESAPSSVLLSLLSSSWLLQPPSRRASMIMALQESTSAAKYGNLQQDSSSVRARSRSYCSLKNLLFGLVLVVGVAGVLDGVLDQLLQRVLLADELDEFGLATAAAEHDELFLLHEELLDGAALLLVE
jgi:hypothetical protein